MEGVDIEVFLKANTDHKDFDLAYIMNSARNDAKLSDEYEDLRKSKENLAQFEKNIENELVNNKLLINIIAKLKKT